MAVSMDSTVAERLPVRFAVRNDKILFNKPSAHMCYMLSPIANSPFDLSSL